MKKYLVSLELTMILLLSSCDPNFAIGLKNNSDTKITVVTIFRNNASSKIETVVLPGNYVEFSTTAGMYNMDTNDIFFDNLQIIKYQDTIKVNDRKNIYNMFTKEPSGAFFIIIDKKTKFKN
jgi:hypothetical protein